MIPWFLNIFRSKHRGPKIFFYLGVAVIKIKYLINHKPMPFDTRRFAASNWLKTPELASHKTPGRTLEIVFVSTRKDFDVLVQSIEYAARSVAKYELNRITIIVPARDLAVCRLLVSHFKWPVLVSCEDEYVSRDQFKRLSQRFGSRDTWVLQQLLKVSAVVSSTASAVLIVDSDTLLLNQRNWLEDSGKQILTPSEEFHPDYYLFLSVLGISAEIPEYTFISHHMIMQPIILREILKKIDLADINNLISYCVSNSNPNSESPFCIEYELYGQYMMKYRRGEISLEKWSNLAISKRHLSRVLSIPLLLKFLKSNYDSVSFHSWS